jgi:OPT family small oligopeptide transporter
MGTFKLSTLLLDEQESDYVYIAEANPLPRFLSEPPRADSPLLQQELEDADGINELKYAKDEAWEGNISLMDNSPYPEVRRVVPVTDDPTIQINHWRTWLLTTIFVIVFAGTNQFFSLRYPSLKVSYLVAQIISFPLGKALARFMPDIRFPNHPWFNLNPGPYTIKEHGILTICVSLTATAPYATEIIVAQNQFYKRDYGVVYQLFLVWTTQSLGYGLAGLSRRFLVDPPAMIWPQTLINVAMFETLHDTKGKSKTIGLSKYNFFLISMGISFVWYWVPGYFMTSLSYFSFILWSPLLKENFLANFLFGVKSGLGLIPITFDYTQISQALSGSVFVTPYWVIMNTYCSVLIFFVFLLSLLYSSNVWAAKYLPVISTSTFDNKQEHFNVTKILTDNFTIDYEKYKAYSPIYIPFSYLLSYALNFAAVIAIFTHTYLYHGTEIWAKLKSANHGGEDIHKRLMNTYKEVPNSWYLILFVIVLLMSFITVGFWETGFPWWGLVIALSISILNFIPQGILEGITNQNVGLNVITEMICGYIIPYKPLANLLFKIYGYVVMRHGLSMSMDLKLGRYLKIDPRLLFFAQLWSTFIAGLTTVFVQKWMTTNIKDICTPNQPDGFICAGGRTIFNASIIWSLPKHLFSVGKPYNPLLWFFLIGGITPCITFYLFKKFPKKWYGQIHSPVFFTGPTSIPPSTPYNYGTYFVTATIIVYLRKVWPNWYGSKGLVLGASIETGVALAVVVIFLSLQYRGHYINWIGNTIWKDTLDYRAEPYYKLKQGEIIPPL